MTQLSLFTDEPLPPSSGSDTSEAAAQAVANKSHRLREKILAWLRGVGSVGATDGEMQVYLGLSGDTQRPRRWELAGGNEKRPWPALIVDSGRTRPTASGNKAIVWILKGA